MKTAQERASEMMSMKIKDLPLLAKEYLIDLSSRVGFCGEVCLTAYATYAQLEEGLKCDDDLYLPNLAEVTTFKRIKRELDEKHI